MEDVKNLVKISIMNQALIYLLDEIENAPFYVRERKQQYNRFKKIIERDINLILAAGNESEHEYWQQCAEKIYNEVQKLEINIELQA